MSNNLPPEFSETCELTIVGSSDNWAKIRANVRVTIAVIKERVIDYLLEDLLRAIAAELELLSEGHLCPTQAYEMAGVLFAHDPPGAQRVLQLLRNLLAQIDGNVRQLIEGGQLVETSEGLNAVGTFSALWPESIAVSFGGPLEARSRTTGYSLERPDGLTVRTKIHLPSQFTIRLA